MQATFRSVRDVEKYLYGIGFRFVRQKGDHRIWRRLPTEQVVVYPASGRNWLNFEATLRRRGFLQKKTKA